MRAFDATRFAPEEVVVRGREAYLSLPNGQGRAKLPAAFDKAIAVPATARNWKTVVTLQEMAHRTAGGR
jgi:uncharacterized protein (DUF1697 family)